MSKKPIYEISFDLFEEIRKRFPEQKTQKVSFALLPRSTFWQVVLPVHVPRGTTVFRTLDRSPKKFMEPLVQKPTYVVLLYGEAGYNTHCSIRLHEPLATSKEAPGVRIVELDAGKITPEGFLAPHVLFKYFKPTIETQVLTALFFNTYQSLYFSGVYEIEEVCHLPTANKKKRRKSLNSQEESEDQEYLSYFPFSSKAFR